MSHHQLPSSTCIRSKQMEVEYPGLELGVPIWGADASCKTKLPPKFLPLYVFIEKQTNLLTYLLEKKRAEWSSERGER